MNDNERKKDSLRRVQQQAKNAMNYMNVDSSSLEQLGECIICMEGYDEDKIVVKLPCGHTFHEACIFAWIDMGKDRCPTCRAIIRKKDSDANEGGM